MTFISPRTPSAVYPHAMKCLLIVAALSFLSLPAFAQGQCEFLAQVAGSEEAVLSFEQFQAEALLTGYSVVNENGRMTESYAWSIPGDSLGIHVTAVFDGKDCAVIDEGSEKID